EKRVITFRSKTKQSPAGNRVVVPGRNGAGDPTVSGATLTVYNAAGSGEKVVVSLPASGWTAYDNGKGYRFKVQQGPITQVIVKADQITVKGGRAAGGYTLNEPSQGRMALRLQLGTQPPWCADVPPRTSGNPPSSASNDRVDRYIGVRKAPPP